jgi:hypothetical protein
MFSAHLSAGAASEDIRSGADLRDMSISEHKHVLEVCTGAKGRDFHWRGRRRAWTADEKATIVAESRVRLAALRSAFGAVALRAA